MKILIVGVSGMLGHKIYHVFRDNGLDTYGIMRASFDKYRKFNLFNEKKIIDRLDVTNTVRLGNAVRKIRPGVIINAVGVVKQICNEPISAIALNSLYPHQLAKICTENKARLVQVSTDCVFSGKKGNYTERDIPDAEDLYGRTKLLGEVTYNNHLTIRTSIIGRELFTKHGLIEWFISQTGRVKGYTKAIFSGLTTSELGRILVQVAKRSEIKGLLNISTRHIDKYSLLQLVKKEFERDDIMIEKYAGFVCDRSLNNARMRKLGIKAKDYPEMVRELAKEGY